MSEDLHVEARAQALVGEREDALHDDDRGRLDAEPHLGAVVQREVVGGAIDGPSGPERVEVLAQQIELQRIGVVVVDLLTLLVREVALRTVVVILLEEHAGAGRERLEDRARDGALAGARAPGDTEDVGNYVGRLGHARPVDRTNRRRGVPHASEDARNFPSVTRNLRPTAASGFVAASLPGKVTRYLRPLADERPRRSHTPAGGCRGERSPDR